MTASTASREHFEEKDLSTQQCLPPISDLISNISTQHRTPASLPSTQPSNDFLSSRLAPSPAHGKSDKQACLQWPQSTPSYTERHTLFRESPKMPFNERARLPPVSERSTYAHTPAPPSAHATGNSWTPRTSAQQHMSSYPTSSFNGPPHGYSASDERQHMEDVSGGTRPQSEATLYSVPWSYKESLYQLEQCAKTLLRFAESYNNKIQDQHNPHPIPERLPTKQEVTNMISNHELQLTMLKHIRETVRPLMRNPQAVEAPNRQPMPQVKHDAPMLGDDRTSCTVSHAETQRPPATPPRICHSCNRVDTPEWRRGPDGSRTLCNACGLHYAKFSRKRQLKRKLRLEAEGVGTFTNAECFPNKW